MSRGLLWFITIILSVFFAVGVLFYVARTHDGPLEIIAGGPFKSGEYVTAQSDLSLLDQEMTIELQTMTPLRSRTMWLVVVDNRPFVISSYMKSRVGKVWKKWPHTLVEDNRALVRSNGKIYRFEIDRRMTDPALDRVLDRFNEKYRTDYDPEIVESGRSWLFELTPAANQEN